MTNKLLKRTVFSGLTLIFTFLLLTLSNTANASHYRYGNISWSRANATTRTVTFTVTQAWRKTAFSGVVLGGTVNPGTPLNFGDATSANVILTVTSINTVDDWFYGTYTVAHTYAGTGTAFTASYSSCCRIGFPLQNNSNGNMASQSVVNLVAGNTGSPVSTMPPIINVSTGNAAATFNIPASDPDGTALNFSLASAAQVGSGWVNLAGFSVNATTGLATFNTVGKAVGNLYSTAVVVTDAHGSKTIVDFIIKIVNTSTPPVFDYSVTPVNNIQYNITPGQTLNFSVKARDTDIGSTVTLSVVGLTGGMNLAPLLPTTANPVTTAFSWTPTTGQLGLYILNFTAQDNIGTQAQTSVKIYVSMNPTFVVPPTPVAGSDRQILSGVLHTDIIQANNPDINVLTRINSATLPVGATITPTLPSSYAANPSVTLNWTPTPADWGVNTLSYTALDQNGRTANHSYELVVNTLPAFTSAPIEEAEACVLYTYTVTASDVNIPYGDVVNIVSPNLPSWLTLTNTGNGTAVLSGTPTSADLGTYSIQLEAADIYHHGNNIHVHQEFDIVVADTEVPAVTCPSNISLAACQSVANWTVNANDNCGIASAVSTPASGSTFNYGTTAVNVVVTDVNGNISNCSFNVTRANDMIVTATASAILCNGGNSTVTVSANGGTAPYTGDGNFTVTAGNYSYTVTDANGCSTTTSGSVSEPAALAASSSSSSILCNGGSSTVTVSANGGTAPYTGDGNFTVTAGNFSYTVTDANGCSTTTSGSVSEPTVLVASSSSSAILCNGGSSTVTVSANGGTAPYTGDGNFTVTAGNYSYTVTDANGCSTTTSGSVSEPAALAASSSSSSILCNGGSSTVTVSANGGTAPYSGDGNFTVTAGNYSYTVTDANGCSASTSVTIGQPTVLVATIAPLPVSPIATCAYGANNANILIGYGNGPSTATLVASATGGAPGYTYSWFPTSNLSSSSIANPVFTPSQTSGCTNYIYTVTVTDANGCTTFAEVTVKVVNVVSQYNTNGSVKKVKICHITSSATNSEVDIEISPNAVATHLAHGDCLGGCSDNCDPNARFAGVEHDDHFQGGSVDVAPNPNNGVFTLDITPAIPNTEVTVVIYDVTGKLIYSKSYADAMYIHEDIDLNQLTGGVAGGMYMINVINEEYLFTRKVSVTQ